MPSAFLTFKLVPMAQTNENTSLVQPSTPHPPHSHTTMYQGDEKPAPTPTKLTSTSGLQMNPPPPPRLISTPAREVREGSAVSSSGAAARKPRQNLDERDHMLMVKHCYEQREHFKEGTKAQFWNGVGSAFQRDTGKVLAQMSATVGRLVDTRRRQIADWEAGSIPHKPKSDLYDLIDKWIDFLKAEDADAEEERMKQIVLRKKADDNRLETRRHVIAQTRVHTEEANHSRERQETEDPSHDNNNNNNNNNNKKNTSGPRNLNGSLPSPSEGSQFPPSEQQQSADVIVLSENPVPPEMNGARSQKRKRVDEYPIPREFPAPGEAQQQQAWKNEQLPHHPQQHQPPHSLSHPQQHLPPHPPPHAQQYQPLHPPPNAQQHQSQYPPLHQQHPPPPPHQQHQHQLPPPQPYPPPHPQQHQPPPQPYPPPHPQQHPQYPPPQLQPPPPPPQQAHPMQPPQHHVPQMQQLQQIQPQNQVQALQHRPSQSYFPPTHSDVASKVIIEGQLTKEDWKEIIASEARLRAVETKMEKIETLVAQNNKLLLQLVQSRSKDGERSSEERVPVHLDAEFERDYLSGRYSKTPLLLP